MRPLGPISELHSVFSNRDLPSHLRATEGNSNSLCVWGVSWATLANKLEEGFPCLVLGFLLDSLEGNTASPNGEISFKLTCVHRLKCIVVVFARYIMILRTCSDFLTVIYFPSLLYLCLLPTPPPALSDFLPFYL